VPAAGFGFSADELVLLSPDPEGIAESAGVGVNLLLCSLSVGGLLFAELSPSDLTPAVLALPDSEPCGLLLVDVEPAGTLFAAELFSATLPIETLLAVVEEFAVVLSPSETLLRPAADVFSSVWVVAGVLS